MAIYCQISKLSSFSPFLGFRGKIAFLRPLEWFFEKMAESGPPLFFNFKGGPLSSIFSINHSKCLKMTIYGLKVDIFKEIAILRHLEWFLEKMEESRPPLKLKNNGGLLSAIFS